MSENNFVGTRAWQALRALLIAILILIGAQGWFGDFVNIFQAPADGVTPPPLTVGGLTGAIASLQPAFFLMVHGYLGLTLIVLAAAIVGLVFARPAGTGARVWAVLGLLSIISAAYGGFAFVRSGFADGGGSAQMGGSFIFGYACYFMTFYYTKRVVHVLPSARPA